MKQIFLNLTLGDSAPSGAGMEAWGSGKFPADAGSPNTFWVTA